MNATAIAPQAFKTTPQQDRFLAALTHTKKHIALVARAGCGKTSSILLAIDILRKRGVAQAVKKADRTQHEGALFIAQSADKAALVSLKCETDFVARNEAFVELGQSIAQTLLDKGVDAAKKIEKAS